MSSSTTPPQIAAETLVETLTDLAAKARLIADDLDGDNAEAVCYLAKVADDCARMAVIMNMQRESVEARQAKVVAELEAELATIRKNDAEFGDRFAAKMKERREKRAEERKQAEKLNDGKTPHG